DGVRLMLAGEAGGVGPVRGRGGGQVALLGTRCLGLPGTARPGHLPATWPNGQVGHPPARHPTTTATGALSRIVIGWRSRLCGAPLPEVKHLMLKPVPVWLIPLCGGRCDLRARHRDTNSARCFGPMRASSCSARSRSPRTLVLTYRITVTSLGCS